ncbi:MAG: TIGR04282 family arsenosugar biosynthesis glycosyltransferase [Gammaproteobacteria bacterium]
MKYPQGRILVFAKAPVPGEVKTRLMPQLDAAECAELHKKLVARTLSTAIDARLCQVELWCSPDPSHAFFGDCAKRFGITLARQDGSDLGARMRSALGQTLDRSEFAIVIGSDCPTMTGAYLAAACEPLAHGTRCVLGPAEDGGYVLIGCREVDELLFSAIAWGSSGVLTETLQRLARLGWDYTVLSELWDLDRPQDLARISHHDGEPSLDL